MLAIFNYHYIVDPENPLQKNILGPFRDEFEAQVRRLKRNFRILSPNDFEEFFDGSDSAKREVSIAFSFDDGAAEHASYAAGFLADEKINGLFFIPTCIFEGLPPLPSILHYSIAVYRMGKVVDWINEELRECGSNKRFDGGGLGIMGSISELKRFLRYELDHALSSRVLHGVFAKGMQRDVPDVMNRLFITEGSLPLMKEAGHTFGAHTHTHPSLGAWHSKAFADTEVTAPILKLGAITRSRIRHFAFPFGASKDCHENYDLILKQSGIHFAYTTSAAANLPSSNRLRVARRSVYRADTPESLMRFMESEKQRLGSQ